MQLDLDSLYVGDKLTTITLEAIGDDKVRVNQQSWTDAVVIRAEEALEALALGSGSICAAASGRRRTSIST